MGENELARKREFKKALIDADMTARAWAADAGVTVTHLNRVLGDPKQSAPLTEKIAGFIKAPKKSRRLAKAS